VTTRLLTANDEFQVLQSLLTNRTKRHRHGKVVVQGVRPTNLALAHDWRVTALLYPANRKLSRWAAGIVDSDVAADRYEVAPELFRELSQKEEPADLLVVVAIPERRLDEVQLGRESVVVVLDRPGNPGNLGTIIRSCDAFGVSTVIVTGHAADPYDPAAIRASTGSLFACPVVLVPGIGEVRTWLEAAEWDGHVVGTDEGGSSIHSARLQPPLVIVLGNEADGLSNAARELCDSVVGVPVVGSASSLNVATAAGIVLYEVRRPTP